MLSAAAASAGDASGKSMTRFTFSAGSYRWGDDHPNALARKVKFFIKRGVVRPRHNAWTSDKGLQGKIKEFNLAGGCSAGLGLASDFWTTPQIKFFDFQERVLCTRRNAWTSDKPLDKKLDFFRHAS